MKKLIAFTLLLLISITVAGVSVHATESASSLPGGKNYLEAANFDYDNSSLWSIDSIAVKPNTDYTITIPEMLENVFLMVEVGDLFDNYASSCGTAYGGQDYACTFNTGSFTSIEIYIEDPTMSQFMSSYGLDGNFQLEEGAIATAIEVYIAPVGDFEPPLIDGGGGVWLTNVDNPDALATIKGSLTATDNTDGDITVGIEVVTDAYTGNENILGDYDIVFRSTDSSGNSTTITITVRVVDVVDPIINLNGSSTIYVEYPSVYSEPGAVVSDNYDTGVSAIITGTVNSTVLGTYTVYYNYSDTSGNVATQVSRTVIVQDTTSPEITLNGSSTVYIEFGENYTELNAEATDNYDTGLTVLKTGSVNVGVLGTYVLSYDITDSNGNIADTVTRTVIVQDTTSPVITGTITYNYTITEIISLQNIVDLFTASDIYEGDMTADIVVSLDTLTGFETTLGTYTFTLTVTDTSGNSESVVVTVNIIDDEAPVFSTTAHIMTLEYADTLTQEQLKEYFGIS